MIPPPTDRAAIRARLEEAKQVRHMLPEGLAYETGHILSDLAALLADVERLTQERDESDALRERVVKLLDETTTALKGEPAPLRLHSWADTPDVARALKARASALAQQVETLTAALAEAERVAKFAHLFKRAARDERLSDKEVRNVALFISLDPVTEADIARGRELVHPEDYVDQVVEIAVALAEVLDLPDRDNAEAEAVKRYDEPKEHSDDQHRPGK